MSAWAESAFARYCIVPVEGTPILFEGESAVHVSERVAADVRQAHYWYMEGTPSQEYVRRWAAEIRSVLRELGLEGQPLAVDKLDTPGFLALQAEQIRLVDSSPATVDAREVKTAEEVQLMRINGGIRDAMLAEFEAAVRPEVRECELLAVLAESLLRRRGEYLFTGLVAAGTNTNPWGSEAGDKEVLPGELVGVDTDAVGYEGYVIDVSRTFLCDGQPTRDRRRHIESPIPGHGDGRSDPSGDDLRRVRAGGACAACGVPGQRYYAARTRRGWRTKGPRSRSSRIWPNGTRCPPTASSSRT